MPTEEDLKHFTIKAKIKKEVLAHYLFEQPFKNKLRLDNKKNNNDTIIIKGKVLRRYTVIQLYEDPKDKEITIINTVVYAKGWYGLENNSFIDEFAITQKESLMSILKRKEITATILEESLAHTLVLDTLDDFSTAYSQFEMTRWIIRFITLVKTRRFLNWW